MSNLEKQVKSLSFKELKELCSFVNEQYSDRQEEQYNPTLEQQEFINECKQKCSAQKWLKTVIPAQVMTSCLIKHLTSDIRIEVSSFDFLKIAPTEFPDIMALNKKYREFYEQDKIFRNIFARAAIT